MQAMWWHRLSRFGTLVLLLSVGCSGYRSGRQAKLAEQQGDWDHAVLQYLELVDDHPDNVTYKTGLLRAKIKASQMHFERAKTLHEAGALNRALEEYRQAVQLDPSNQYAQVELEKLIAEIASADASGKPSPTLEELKGRTRGARAQPPVLDPRSIEPISLSFPRPVSIQDIYRALGKAFGIDILFDPKLRDQEISIELEQVIAQDALEILMRAANHFYKVLDEHTIIVVEDTPQNRRAYEDLVIQTFFLSNAEVKDVMTMLRSLVGAKNVAANEQLNAIVLRDSADKVKVAESIIHTNDKSPGEVVIDVELLQINTSKLQELGVLLSDYQITQRLDPGLQVGDAGAYRVSDLEFVDQADWLVTIPSFTYDFLKSATEAQLLASPQVRVSDGEKALVHIGDQVPIPVTTFNTSATVGANIVPITSFQYQDIGIRLDITPRIHHNKEITLDLKVEVSNISGSISGVGGSAQPIIGTRRVESKIRLMDGETNFLAGLIRTDEIITDTGIPGLMDIPIIGRLFSHKVTDINRTDLILTLTPHIIRTPNVEEEDLLPIWVGTEANITFRGGSPRVESEVEGPFDEEADDDAERIREMIRRRIQNLPRGLQGEAREEESPGEEAPPGQDLARPSGPQDMFEEDREEEEEEEEPPLASLAPSSHPGALVAGLSRVGEDTFRFASSSAGAAPKVQILLLPSSQRVIPGDTFDVTIGVQAARPVSHLPITLHFDPTLLQVIAVRPGEFLGPEGASRFLSDFSRPGRIVLGASRLGEQQGVVGSGAVGSIRFRALRSGRAVVSFEKGDALDQDLRPLKPVTRVSTVIRIVRGEGEPERFDPGDRSPRSDLEDLAIRG